MIDRESYIKSVTLPKSARQQNCKSCSVKTLMEETQSIDKVQTFIDYLNAHVLHSFKISLVMEET